MLAKLKRGLRRTGDTIRRPFHHNRPEKLDFHDFHLDWDGIRSFSEVLEKGSHVSGPLKPEIDELWRFIEMFESNRHKAKIRSREEYEKLGIDINELFRVLSKFFDGTSAASITHESLVYFARRITNEANALQGEQLKMGEQHVESGVDVQGVLGCNRRVRTTLGRFALNENTDIWKIPDENLLATRLDSLPHSPAAQYPSAGSNGIRRTGCTPNTRIKVLQQLRSWAHYNLGPRIFWLNGMTGTGKTTIAYSFCEQLESAGMLAASFFCSRQLPACRDVKRILPSISYQLSSISRPFRCALSSALKDPEVHNLPFSEQPRKLVAEPLLKIKHTFPANMVIVIDALDECEDDEDVKQALDSLLRRASNLPAKFFITSRPSPITLDRMRNKWDEDELSELSLRELDHSAVQEDIRTYLGTKLKPGKFSGSEIANLARRSRLLFIYAAAFVNYLGHNNFSQRTKRLKVVLGGSISTDDEDNQDIDILFTTILQVMFDNSALEPSKRDQMTLVLHTVACAQKPLTVAMLARLLKLDDASSVHGVLHPLQSVLRVLRTNGPVTLLYSALPDYMLDQQRSNRFYCDPKKRHAGLADACFDLINAPSLPFNICKLESSYLRDREAPNIDKRVKEAISPELLYACQYWGAHVELAGDYVDFLHRLHEFLATRLLLWMEILNLNRRMAAAVSQLYRLHVRLKEINGAAITQDLAHDAWKFVAAFTLSPMSDSTPHIYVSMLPFWPEERPVSKHYIPGMLGLVEAIGPGMRKREWTVSATLSAAGAVACVAHSPNNTHIASGLRDKTIRIWNTHTGQFVGRSLWGHASWIYSVSYSPNGANIVSGSSDRTIRIWNAHTGKSIGQPLEGHTDWVYSVLYSPNGAHIASGSLDKTIRIWDAHTGQPVGQPLRGHTDAVYCVAYSPNSACIVSGSRDKTIRIWDTHTEQPVGQPLRGHTDWVYSIAYSPNSAHIVSGSRDKTIRIWDAHTGQPVGRPLEGHTELVCSIAYSPDSAYIVSGSRDKTVRIWDARTGQSVGRAFKGHTDSVTSAVYSPDGAYIVSGSFDETICIWDHRPPAEVSSVDSVPSSGSKDPVSRPSQSVPITNHDSNEGMYNTLFSLPHMADPLLL